MDLPHAPARCSPSRKASNGCGRPVAADALATRSGTATGRRLRVVAGLRPAVIPGADPTLLASLLGNLVDNAVRHNVDGGQIRITTRPAAGRAVLTIANTGPVVPPDAVDRIQQPFQRLTPGRTDGSEGSGPGLAIVCAIADSHEATLRVRPDPTGGLHVEVEFPAS